MRFSWAGAVTHWCSRRSAWKSLVRPQKQLLCPQHSLLPLVGPHKHLWLCVISSSQKTIQNCDPIFWTFLSNAVFLCAAGRSTMISVTHWVGRLLYFNVLIWTTGTEASWNFCGVELLASVVNHWFFPTRAWTRSAAVSQIDEEGLHPLLKWANNVETDVLFEAWSSNFFFFLTI